MIEIMDSNRLIELVIEKHKKLLETYHGEFSEIESKFNILKQQSDAIKKEIESTGTRVEVLNEKYHLLFYQAKKQREEILNSFFEKMRKAGITNLFELQRLSGRIEEHEKKLQSSKHIEDEEKNIMEIKKLLYELGSAGAKAGIVISFEGIIEKLNEANQSHKELISLHDKPKQNSESLNDHNKMKEEVEGRYNWLRHRIDSHKNALSHWEKQRGGAAA